MPHNRRSIPSYRNLAIAIFPFVCAIAFALLRRTNREGYYAFVKEDGVVEFAQALCYVAAAVLGCAMARTLFQKSSNRLGVMFSLYATGMFTLFGEEISWGQRIIGWHSPEYFLQNNIQSETTLHNDARLAGIVHPIIILTGLYGMLSPLLHSYLRRQGYELARFFTTRWATFGFFFVYTSIYVVYEYLNPLIKPWYGFDLILWQDLESAEFFFTSGILAWTLITLFEVRAGKNSISVEQDRELHTRIHQKA